MSTAGGGIAGVLPEIRELVAEEAEADVVLQRAVAALQAASVGIRWVKLSFVEEGKLEPGPQAGDPEADATSSLTAPIHYDGKLVGELTISSDENDAFTPGDGDALATVAAALADHCLVGWDTGGVPWEDVT